MATLKSLYQSGLQLHEPIFDQSLANYHLGVNVAGNSMRISNQAYKIGASGIAGTAVFSDVPEEATRLNTEIDSFTKEMKAQIFHDDGSRDQVLLEWYTANWIPFLQDWIPWRQKHESWYHNMFLSAWHEVQEYRARFIMLHDAAKVVGFKTSVDPTPIRRDAFQQVGDSVGDAIGKVWSLIKIVILAGVIIVGIVFVGRYMH
jgi:hypothetical protein